MRIEILNSAKEDLINGADFYETSEKGLGSYFLDSLFSDIDSLLIYAGVHQVFYADLHRFLAKRFPFAIYYRQEKDLIRICVYFQTKCGRVLNG